MVLASRVSLIVLVVAGGAAARDDFVPQRPEFEAIARTLYEGTNTYLGLATIDRMRETLADPQLGDQLRLDTRGRLVLKLLQAGRVDDAVTEMEDLFAWATSRPETARMVGLHRLRGLTYLRKAEIANCVERHNAQCCIFPLTGGGLHDVRDPAADAQASFEKLLQLSSGDLKARWLLNVSAMALGDWPEGLAANRVIPPKAFASDYEIGRFPDVAPELGIDTFNLCGGVIVEDFDNDGHLDIVTSTFDPAGPLTFYRATGDGRYEDRSAAARADDQLGGLNIVGADYDNDGDEDVLILRGAWLFDDGQIRNSLLRNDGGTFTDVTRTVGLAEPARPTQAAAWGDFDNDGDLDLYVGNESRPRHHPQGDYPGQLFLNAGGGSFTDVALQAGVTNDRYCKGVAAGDYDNDGDLDLYLSNVGPNRLYRNEGDGTFSDVAAAAGVTEPEWRSFACWFFDYDNDGRLDLFVVAYQASIADLAAEALDLPHQAAYPRLYRNRGNGTFEDVTEAAGLRRVLLPMGANFGDLDNDGWLDMYLSTGDPDYQSLMPNIMLRNDAGRRFQDVTTSGGFGHLQKGHGVAFADLDRDGDQDIYHQLGGFYPG
ncbi:MAG: FG-GAP repeat domain-containing protein, partial [Planctomycetota bacterium]